MDFSGKLAVITGGGTGMGRELALQLAAEGCDVAFCDVVQDNMDATLELVRAQSAQGVSVTAHRCDVANEIEVTAFRDAVLDQHGRDHVNLLFNNAGIGGGASMVGGSREDWERTFDICWFGVYYCTRAFMPALVRAAEARLVNTSSVNGFWATLGPGSAHSAYAAAKFAVKGFSEALIHDLEVNAPHVGVSVVMPGHIGTDIALNTGRIMGRDTASMTPAEKAQRRDVLARRGLPVDGMSDAQLDALMQSFGEAFRDNAPMTAAAAATVILEGVRAGRWRILVGEDARVLDELVREQPEAAYTAEFFDRLKEKANWGLGG